MGDGRGRGSSGKRRDERAALRVHGADAGLEHVQRRRREEDPRPDDDGFVRRRLRLEALGGLRPRPLGRLEGPPLRDERLQFREGRPLVAHDGRTRREGHLRRRALGGPLGRAASPSGPLSAVVDYLREKGEESMTA